MEQNLSVAGAQLHVKLLDTPISTQVDMAIKQAIQTLFHAQGPVQLRQGNALLSLFSDQHNIEHVQQHADGINDLLASINTIDDAINVHSNSQACAVLSAVVYHDERSWAQRNSTLFFALCQPGQMPQAAMLPLSKLADALHDTVTLDFIDAESLPWADIHPIAFH